MKESLKQQLVKPQEKMSTILIQYKQLSYVKNTMLVVFLIVSVLLLISNFLLGFPAILIVVTLLSLQVGVEISLNKRKYRYYKSIYGKRFGEWKSLEVYSAIVVLKKNLKEETLSPSLANSLNYSYSVFDVHLADYSHRKKLSLKKCKTIEEAVSFAEKLSTSLNFPIEKYNPIISSKSRYRRRMRKGR